MRPRTELHDILCAVLGSKNCYFQPPTGTQIKYPAIVYSFNGVRTKAADNKSYMKYGKYTITHCYKSPKESLVEILPEALPFCSFDSSHKVDGIYNDTYDLSF